MKKEKVERRIGDIIPAEFIKNHREGRKPVCLIDGRICFIDRDYKGQFIHEHSIWHVEITEIKDKVMVVNPVQEIKTAMENIREIKQKMKLLETKHRPKHKKPKVHYPYKSQQERKKQKEVSGILEPDKSRFKSKLNPIETSIEEKTEWENKNK